MCEPVWLDGYADPDWGKERCLPVFRFKAQNANALLLNGAFLQGSYCGSLPPDSDEEYVKYRIKIWTVVGRKRI